MLKIKLSDDFKDNPYYPVCEFDSVADILYSCMTNQVKFVMQGDLIKKENDGKIFCFIRRESQFLGELIK